MTVHVSNGCVVPQRESPSPSCCAHRYPIMVHPLILGEIACGSPPNRTQTLSDLRSLRQPRQASVPEVMDFIERERLFGLGCGLVDMLLLASALMTPETELWTLNKRLSAMTDRFGVMHRPSLH